MSLTLKHVKEIMHSNMHVAEFMYLLNDIKPVNRYIVRVEELQNYLGLAQHYGLFVTLGPYIDMHNHNNSNYSNKGVLVDKADTQIIYVSKNKELAEVAGKLELSQNHKGLGDVLGYPQCCCTFFEHAQATQQNDYLLATIHASGHDNLRAAPYPITTNIVLRYVDLTLLPHFPCSLSCPESNRMGMWCMELLLNQRPTYAKILQAQLQGTFLYIPDTCAVRLSEPHRNDKTITYAKTDGWTSIELPQSIELLANNQIRINKDIVTGYVLTFEDTSTQEKRASQE